ncbi:MAG: ADP-ribosylglycohydrolase family protein, partial [Cystobacterineae bacterium]|nr:ADP-ribosylglycohydrolase family protein [Cystobacterineae bacterium]
PPRKTRRPPPSSPPPLVGERLRGSLFGLWLGERMGASMRGLCFPLPEFPSLYIKPKAVGPPLRYPREYGLPLGFACSVAHCLFEKREFLLGELLLAFRRYATLLYQTGVLPPPTSTLEEAPSPTEYTSTEENTPPPPSLESGLAWALEQFPRFHCTEAFLTFSAHAPPPPPPISDTVLLLALPLACFLYAHTPQRIAAVAQTALAMHTGPLGALASVALAALTSESILSKQPCAPMADLLEAMHRDLSQTAFNLLQMGVGPASSVQQAQTFLLEDIAFAQKHNPNLYGPALNLRQHAGHLRLSFRLALWELFHAPESTPGNAVEDVIRRGGSPTTQGALVASLCGARWGKTCLPQPTGLEFSPPPASPPPPPAFRNASFLEALAEAMVANLNKI